MKTISCLIVLITCSLLTHSQKIIDNPRYGISNTPNLKITRIELTSDETILSFHVSGTPEQKVSIHPKSYIQIEGHSDSLFMTKQETFTKDIKGGITIPQIGLNIILHFPPIRPSVCKIDYGEPIGGGWKIYDIETGEHSNCSPLPKELLGNWFSAETGQWTFSFWDTLAVFENKYWKYHEVRAIENLYEIKLENRDKVITLICKLDGEKSCLLGYSKNDLVQYSTNTEFLNNVLNEKVSPITGAQSGNVIYSGIVKGFNTRMSSRLCICQLIGKSGNIIETHTTELDKNGFFRFDFMVNGLQKIRVFLPNGNEELVLLPGKNLFHLVNSGETEFPSLFMGEGACIAYRSEIINKLSDNIEVRNDLQAMTKSEYAEILLGATKADLDKLKDHNYLIPAKIRQKDNMFFIPRRSIYVKINDRVGTAASDSFWISNEITNREYRKFFRDVQKHPDRILQWESTVRNSVNGFLEKKINVEIYSEIAKKLIDSATFVTVSGKNGNRNIKLTNYFNNAEYDDFPVIGIPVKSIEYYCAWRNIKEKWENNFGYVLANELVLNLAKDYSLKIYNDQYFQDGFEGLHKVPRDHLADLESNAPEWMVCVFSDDLSNERKYTVFKNLKGFNDTTLIENKSITETKYAGFRIVLPASTAKQGGSLLTLLVYVFGIGFFVSILALLILRWLSRKRLQVEQQQRRLRELELTAIRSQMNPHFLFNSLNSVQNLIQQNRSQEANQYLADFAGLIRKVLWNSEKEEISLAEELETVSQYLSLEKLRFEFDFSVSVAEGIDPQNTMVPSMLIQPFAENAIVHGLQNKPENRKLIIMFSKNQEGIKIIIEDNGIGREAALKFATGKNGKGSKLMKERLEILREKQGEKYWLEIVDIRNEGATGTRVEILIPEEK